MNIYPRYQEDALKSFEFLISEFGFKLAENKITDAGAILVYSKGDRKVRLVFNRMEERFYYYLIQPGKSDYFLNLFIRCEPNINWKDIEPTFDHYEYALAKNVELLKKYGSGFLSGKEDL